MASKKKTAAKPKRARAAPAASVAKAKSKAVPKKKRAAPKKTATTRRLIDRARRPDVMPSTQWLANPSSAVLVTNPPPDTETTFQRATRSSRPPAPSAPISVSVLPDSPSMLSLSALLDDDQSQAVWEKRWGAVARVAQSGRPATGDEVAAVVAWGRSLGRISEETLDRHLGEVAGGVLLGNALIALMRAGAAREAISVSRQLVDACTERQYRGEYASAFVSQVFAAATFVDGDIREEVLAWALELRCAPDPTVYFNAACALALSGQSDRAIANIRLARKHGVPAHVFRKDTDFAKLTKHPDFDQALA